MGRIFTPEQVAIHEVPEVGTHGIAGKFILQELFRESPFEAGWEPGNMLGLNGVQSAMIHGSTVTGQAGIRSDLDVLVNYNSSRMRKALPFIRGVFERAEAAFKVPVEAHVLAAGDLQTPLTHTIDPLFAGHLLRAQDEVGPEWSYNRPADDLRGYALTRDSDAALLTPVALRYTSGKARQLTRAIVAYRGEADVAIMQRALELPSSVGRKVLAAISPEGETQPDFGDKYAMSQAILAKLDQYALEEHTDAVGSQVRLLATDQTYDQLLEETLSGVGSHSAYRKWLEDNYLPACYDALTVAHAWTDILKSMR